MGVLEWGKTRFLKTGGAGVACTGGERREGKGITIASRRKKFALRREAIPKEKRTRHRVGNRQRDGNGRDRGSKKGYLNFSGALGVEEGITEGGEKNNGGSGKTGKRVIEEGLYRCVRITPRHRWKRTTVEGEEGIGGLHRK